MAKKSRKIDAEKAARLKLADAQAKLQSAQERRSRTITKGDMEIEATRERVAKRVEKATREVERRASRVARAEARLMAQQERNRKPALATHLPSTPQQTIDALERAGSTLDEETGRPNPGIDNGLVTATVVEDVAEPSGAQGRALATLRETYGATGATFTEWLTASGISRKTFMQARKALVDRGLVSRSGSGQGARYFVNGATEPPTG